MKKIFLLLCFLVIFIVSVCFACDGSDNAPQGENNQQQSDNLSDNQGGNESGNQEGDGGGSDGVIILPPVDID